MNRYELVYTSPVLIHYTKYVFDKVVKSLRFGEYLIKKIICVDNNNIYNVNFITSFGNIINVYLRYDKPFDEENYFDVSPDNRIKCFDFKKDLIKNTSSTIPLTEKEIELIAKYPFKRGDFRDIKNQLVELFKISGFVCDVMMN